MQRAFNSSTLSVANSSFDDVDPSSVVSDRASREREEVNPLRL